MKEAGRWSTEWMETQQKYWEAWTDMSRKALGLETQQKMPWEQALDHWWQAVSPAMPPSGGDFIGKILDQGKAFFRVADDLIRNVDLKSATGGDWNNLVGKTLGNMEQLFTGEHAVGDDPLHKMMAFWEMPFDNWQRLVSSMSLMPGDLLRNMPHDQVKENLHRFLSAPGLGYTREEQSQYQELLKRALDYQRALQGYSQFFSGMGLKAVERMREILVDKFQAGKPVDSTRALYDLWVASCEDVYSEEVSTEEYARVHGELVNTLMAFKHRLAIIVDEALGAMNMPTRAELRTLQDRLQETRRDNKTLRQELELMKHLVTGGGQGIAPAAATPDEGQKSATKKAPAPRKKAAVQGAPEPAAPDATKA